MIELSCGPDRIPLQLASRVLSAPGVWAPGSRLPLAALGALVTPPLGVEWDGGAARWETRPGAFLWAPPRRPVARFARQLARERSKLPRLWTVAAAAAAQVEQVVAELSVESAVGYLLWDATPESVAAARRGGAALPLLAEIPCGEIEEAPALVGAGADGLWIGPPRGGRGRRRLWGPAALPLVLQSLGHPSLQGLGVPLIAGAGIINGEDAARLRGAGAAAVALDPAWWVDPGLAAQVEAALDA